ncbi:3-hydroxybutyryl-CoA dehydrogenase [Quillaja saponaria]|uniref:3-hydroxybutyryl-CoA dehydrogenase n=1 Tax=Quillaja saponaria TaxID=32244 RepID=A0AAD7PAQ4_QUISA|nr:3-hydroxybutyryl-CoA dehydrogenase [Quillaja saponaria]
MKVLLTGLGDNKYAPCPLLVQYADAGQVGRECGIGEYDYRRLTLLLDKGIKRILLFRFLHGQPDPQVHKLEAIGLIFHHPKVVIIRTLKASSLLKVIEMESNGNSLRLKEVKAMKFLFQCPCCSCFCFMKPKKGKPKVKAEAAKVKAQAAKVEAKEEKKE